MVELGLQRSNITKDWHTVGDLKVRHTHAKMHGQKQQLGTPFVTGGAALLMYPGDSSLGAGEEETANCRCWAEYQVGEHHAR
ncbi:hypothetical protein D9M71_788190 [compost metagenome]